MSLFHVDGELVPAGEACLPVRDRSLAYGDAAVETMRAYGGRIHRWEEHLTGLTRTCEALSIPVPDGLRARIRETLSANDLADARVDLTVTRGEGGDGPTPPSPGETDPTVVVAVDPLPRGGRKGSPPWDGPATVRTAATRVPPAAARPPGLRTAGDLTAVLARLELAEEDEALVRDVDGAVVGGAASDACFVDQGGIHAPDPETVPVSPGVVRGVAFEHARDQGIPVTVGRYDPRDFRTAEEAFLASTTWGIRPVGSVDGVEVGSGPVTDLLRTVFANRIEAEFY
ncbi:4-amino-4-deoxychorismate lyase [Halobacteriales archaeon QS_8_69_26]|nr:MAG: 4-amino-4-deoxychorismate lyase [Halobacteriales archaeon QS_8_69_26]